jgi:hypothetical protein
VVYRLLDDDQGGRAAALTSLAVAQQPGAELGQIPPRPSTPPRT